MLRLALACISSFGLCALNAPDLNLLQAEVAKHRHHDPSDCTTTTTTCGKGFELAPHVCPAGTDRVTDETLCASGKIGNYFFEATGINECNHDLGYPHKGCFVSGNKISFSTCAGGPDTKGDHKGLCFRTCVTETTTTTTTGTAEPVCVLKPQDCDPCVQCHDSVTGVDLSRITQNNLGGHGPDEGVAEIRYHKAFTQTVAGVTNEVDIVFTAESTYQLEVPEQNGVAGLLGIFGILSGSSTDLKFSFQDSTTRDPVTIHKMAVTFYDIDQGKRQKGKQSITSCGPSEMFVSKDTQLTKTSKGNCHTYLAGRRTKKDDHPRDPAHLTSWQMAKAVTFVYPPTDHVDFTSKVRRGLRQRNVVFAFEPAVPCGADDSKNKCSRR